MARNIRKTNKREDVRRTKNKSLPLLAIKFVTPALAVEGETFVEMFSCRGFSIHLNSVRPDHLDKISPNYYIINTQEFGPLLKEVAKVAQKIFQAVIKFIFFAKHIFCTNGKILPHLVKLLVLIKVIIRQGTVVCTLVS